MIEPGDLNFSQLIQHTFDSWCVNRDEMQPLAIDKTTSLRSLTTVDISELKVVVDNLTEEIWLDGTSKRENDFACFEQTQHIIFRFPFDTRDRTSVFSNDTWKAWQSVLMPIIRQAVEPYQYDDGRLGAVMLAKLPAGAQIHRHIDGSPSYPFIHKIHVPIVTNPLVSFFIDPQTYYLREGQAYEVNNIVKHGVLNKGRKDRVHLIFDYFRQN